MASNSEFWEAYSHPEWQRKRLEIMQLHNFQCEDCSSKDKTINVHHAIYYKGAKPWEYENDELMCLCFDCHKSRHSLKNIIGMLFRNMKPFQIRQTFGYCTGLIFREKAKDDKTIKTTVFNAIEFCGLIHALSACDFNTGELSLADFLDELFKDGRVEFGHEQLRCLLPAKPLSENDTEASS